MAAVLTVLGSSVAAAAGGTPPPVSTAKWQQAVQGLRVPGKGCFTASYPMVQWRRTQCKAAPHVPYAPAPGYRSQAVGHGTGYTVGNGTDYSAEVSGSLSSVMGSFDSITPGATETGSFNGGPSAPNTFSLQLNTNTFTSTACAGSPNPGCQGWEQFIYSTHFNMVLIEFTMLNYDATCPSGWFLSGTACVINTFGTGLSSPLTVAELPGVTLTGSASPGGNDTVVLTNPSSGTAIAMNADDLLGLANNWTDVEWGIFGESGPPGNAADFSPGTTLAARTTTHNGTRLAPSCVMEGFTAETNNLNLAPTPMIGTQGSPTLISTQTNGPTSGAPACATARGIRDTHLRTFRNLFYDFQASGDFELATTGPGFIVENRQISSAPMWPNAAVNQAVAARVGKSDVAVCTTPTRLVINKKEVGLANGGHINLPGGGKVSLNGNAYLIQDAAGDSVTAAVNNGSPDWINASVGLGRWPETVQGLLANAGTDVEAVQARSGTVLTAPFAFKEFYGLYGNSWRVPASQSLLSACGTKVASGNPQNVFYPNDLPPKIASAARAACLAAKVRAAPLLDACTVDVAVLGRKAPFSIYRTMPTDITWGKITPPTANRHTTHH